MKYMKVVLLVLASSLIYPSAVSAQSDDCGVPMLLEASKNINWSWYAYVRVYNDTKPAVQRKRRKTILEKKRAEGKP